MEIMIDFDGVIVEQVTPRNTLPTKIIGEISWAVVEKMRFLKKQGYTIIIFTGRLDAELGELALEQFALLSDFLRKHGIPFDRFYSKPWRVSVIVDDIAIKPQDWIKE